MNGPVLGSADVAIIGGGLMGCATALHLAAGGVDVAVIERGSLNREASGANAGSLHLQIYIHPHFPDHWIDSIRPSIALLRDAARSWATMETRLSADCGIRLGGGLWVAETAEEMTLIRMKVAAENADGVQSRIVTREELLGIAPYLGPHVIGGSYLQGEGFANPLLVTPAHARAARAHGARFFTDTAVEGIEKLDGGGFRLTSSKGEFTCRRLVCAAGAWTGVLARMLGLDLPIAGSVGQVSVTDARPPIMLDHMLQHVGKGLTLKQSPQGAFIIGGGWPGHFDRAQGRSVPLQDSIIGNCWVAARTVPEVGQAQLVRSWGGMASGVPDGLPILGPSSQVEGFYLVYAPLGFTMGPICGQVFAELFLTGDASVPVAAFSPDRFATRARHAQA